MALMHALMYTVFCLQGVAIPSSVLYGSIVLCNAIKATFDSQVTCFLLMLPTFSLKSFMSLDLVIRLFCGQYFSHDNVKMGVGAAMIYRLLNRGNSLRVTHHAVFIK